MVAVDRAPIIGASLPFVDADVSSFAVEAGAADDGEILPTISRDPASHR